MTQNNKKHKKRGIYSLLTLVLLIALVQALRGAFLNVENFFSLSKKIEKLQEIHQNSMEQNELLKIVDNYDKIIYCSYNACFNKTQSDLINKLDQSKLIVSISFNIHEIT